jgi:hypothetical protein
MKIDVLFFLNTIYFKLNSYMVISKKRILEEYAKCVQDKSRIYMIENYFKTLDATQNNTVPLKLFPRQKAYLKNLSENIENLASKPRQAGVSTITCAKFACEIALADEDTPENILLIANNLDLSKENLMKIKEFLEQVPWWFWGEEYEPIEDKPIKSIFVKANEKYLILNNKSKVYARSAGPNASRGCSAISRILFDEAAFIETPSTITSAISTTASSAKSIIYCSTPNGFDQVYHSVYSQALKGKNTFKISEFRWYQDPRYNKNLTWTKKNKETGDTEIIKEPLIDNIGNVLYDEEHWNDMVKSGYRPSSDWYNGMCERYNHDIKKISQELDVSFLGSGGAVVDSEITEALRTKYLTEPLYSDTFFTEAHIFKEPVFGHKYLLTADVATGSGADSSVIHILDVDFIDETGFPKIEQVFEYQGKIQGDILGELINKYGRYYGNAFVVVDCQGGTGDPAIIKLQDLGYPNLYYDDLNLKKVTSDEEGKYIEDNTSKMPGFRLSSTRLQQIMNLEKMLRFEEVIPRSVRFFEELKTFIWKNGRPDHQSGYHDDTITAMAMGLFVLQFSFKKLEAVKEKTKAILSSMVLIQNAINNVGNHKLPENKIPLPFFTQKSLDRKLNQNKPINPYTAMNAMAMQQIFGR